MSHGRVTSRSFWAMIAILLLLIVLMIRAFNRHSIIAGILQVPYLAWVCFAAYLNTYIVIAN